MNDENLKMFEEYAMKDATTLQELHSQMTSQSMRTDEDLDEMSSEEKLENVIGECILMLSASLHGGELDADIMKLILAKLMLARQTIKDIAEAKENEHSKEDEIYDILTKSMATPYKNTKIADTTWDKASEYIKEYEASDEYLKRLFEDASKVKDIFSHDRVNPEDLAFVNKEAIKKIKIKKN